jgi:hypothetical protein
MNVIAAQRLRHQHLLGTPLPDPVSVVSALGAVQAQEYPDARWALGLRCAGVTDAQVAQAVDAGAIVRTHVLRPTWHVANRPTCDCCSLSPGPECGLPSSGDPYGARPSRHARGGSPGVCRLPRPGVAARRRPAAT